MALSLFLTVVAAEGGDSPAESDTAPSAPRICRFASSLGSGEVLVVRGFRREDGQPVLETEEILAGPLAEKGFTITLQLLSPTRWQIVEPDLEQHLAGMHLARWQRAPQQLAVEFAPAPGGARRRYAFQWTAQVEPWTSARQRHADLPSLSPAGWRVRFVHYAGL